MDHPRLRGEKAYSWSAFWSAIGSPPLARGKVHTSRRTGTAGGITPACAGKRSERIVSTSLRKDHPRLRGEKANLLYACLFQVGSPPLARGKEREPQQKPTCTGITPACAGKRCVQSSGSQPRRDHPRLRGEKAAFAVAAAWCTGSPPLARGKVMT